MLTFIHQHAFSGSMFLSILYHSFYEFVIQIAIIYLFYPAPPTAEPRPLMGGCEDYLAKYIAEKLIRVVVAITVSKLLYTYTVPPEATIAGNILPTLPIFVFVIALNPIDSYGL